MPMRSPFHAAAACLLLLVPAACGPRAPQLLAPDRIESFCSEKEPRGTAVASILSSTADQIEPLLAPSVDDLNAQVRKNGGIIGHWNAQPLFMPKLAKVLHVSGDYVDVRDVWIDNQLDGADSRIIYVTLAAPGGTKRIALRAYDVQNVCVEGRRLS